MVKSLCIGLMPDWDRQVQGGLRRISGRQSNHCHCHMCPQLQGWPCLDPQLQGQEAVCQADRALVASWPLGQPESIGTSSSGTFGQSNAKISQKDAFSYYARCMSMCSYQRSDVPMSIESWMECERHAYASLGLSSLRAEIRSLPQHPSQITDKSAGS